MAADGNNSMDVADAGPTAADAGNDADRPWAVLRLLRDEDHDVALPDEIFMKGLEAQLGRLDRGANGKLQQKLSLPFISGTHCRFFLDDDSSVRLQDFSSNGVFVDGVPIGKGNVAEQKLQDGKVIDLFRPKHKSQKLPRVSYTFHMLGEPPSVEMLRRAMLPPPAPALNMRTPVTLATDIAHRGRGSAGSASGGGTKGQEALQAMITRLSSDLANHVSKEAQYKAEMQTLQDTNDQLRGELKSKRDAERGLEAKLQAQEVELQKAKQELEDQCRDANEAAEAAATDADRRERQLQQALESEKEAVQEAEAREDALKRDRTALEQELADVKRALVALQEDRASLEERLATATAAKTTQERQLRSEAQQKRELEQRCASQETQIEALKQTEAEQRQRCAALEAEASDLRQSLAEANARAEAAKSVQQTVEQAQEETAAARAERDTAAADLDRKAAEAARLEAQLKSVEGSLAEANERVSSATAEAKANMKAHEERARAAVAEMQAVMNREKGDAARLRERNKSLDNELQKERSDRRKAQFQLSEVNRKLEDMQARLSALSEHEGALKLQLHSVQQAFRTMMEAMQSQARLVVQELRGAAGNPLSQMTPAEQAPFSQPLIGGLSPIIMNDTAGAGAAGAFDGLHQINGHELQRHASTTPTGSPMKGGSDGGYEMGGFTQMDEVESAVPSNGTNGPVLEPVQEECGSEEHEADAAPPPADGEPDADETGMSIPPLNFNDRRDDDDDNDAALLHGHARHAPANGDDVETQALDAGAAFGGGGGGMRAAQREGKENASGDLAFIATAADAAGGLCGKRGSCADDSQDCGMNGGGGGGGALKRPKVGSYQ